MQSCKTWLMSRSSSKPSQEGKHPSSYYIPLFCWTQNCVDNKSAGNSGPGLTLPPPKPQDSPRSKALLRQ